MLGRIVCRDPLSKHRTGSGICGPIHLLQLLERNTMQIWTVFTVTGWGSRLLRLNSYLLAAGDYLVTM